MSTLKPDKTLSHPLRIGTRGSDLALWQARTIQRQLQDLGIPAEYTIIKTRGDRIDHLPFSQLEGKGFFTKELEDALLDGRVDLAVHSMKDLSTEMPEGLCIAALVGREDPSELLLAREGMVSSDRDSRGELFPLREGARIGTSAARRQAQLRDLRPDLEIQDLRGNVPTRIRKLREGQHDAILLARAGVIRLELELDDLFVKTLPVESFVPAPAQGMLAVQCRQDPDLLGALSRLHCKEAALAVEAERHLLARLEGGCRLPFGVNIRFHEETHRLVAFWKEDGSDTLRIHLDGPDPMALADQAHGIICKAAERGAA